MVNVDSRVCSGPMQRNLQTVSFHHIVSIELIVFYHLKIIQLVLCYLD